MPFWEELGIVVQFGLRILFVTYRLYFLVTNFPMPPRMHPPLIVGR